MAKPKAKAKAKAKPKTQAKTRAPAKPAPKSKSKPKPARRGNPGVELQCIRSVIYQVDDLNKARAFYEAALGKQPYFDEPYYVGFDVDGQELGLHPDISKLRPGAGGAVAYWRVADIGATWTHLLELGAAAIESPHDVGGGLSTAIVSDPCGNLVGLIQSRNH
ncbi:MAG TPA: VOC family protein [Kofleriaceae bacterium]|nr:VOC family protein [Kofleriaceae bacterium]